LGASGQLVNSHHRPSLTRAYKANTGLRRQLFEQRFSLFQVERVETFGEPAVNRGEKFASLITFALIAKQPPSA
jgi:hypothetical protein